MKDKVYIILLALCLAACSGNKSGSDKTQISVSIEPQRWILEQLTDSNIVINTILQQGADPETFEATLRQRAQAEDAEIYFITGTLPFEAKMQNVAKRSVDTSEGIELIYGTHDHCHDHSQGHSHSHEAADPHFWTSVSGAKIIAQNMAKTLVDNNIYSKDEVASKLETLENRLDSIDSIIRNQLQGAKQKSFAIWHPSLSYFARDYGLEQLVVGQEGKEMSARQLKERVDHAVADSVQVLFFQKEYDSRTAQTLNDAIGSRMVYIAPMDYNWDSQIILIANELAK